jgi:hypothetical protein
VLTEVKSRLGLVGGGFLHPLEPTVESERPPVIVADESAASSTGLSVTDAISPMRAAVEESSDHFVTPANDDNVVGADIRRQKGSRFRQLGLVCEEYPSTSKNPLKLQLVDVPIPEDLAGDDALRGVG